MIFNDSEITWNFYGKEYKYFDKGIRNVVLKKKYIYFYTYNSDSKVYTHTYITLTGLLIITFHEVSDYITILDKQQREINIKLQSLRDVNTNGSYIFIIAESFPNERLIKYSVNGDKLKEYLPPANYNFVRFFDLPESDTELKVVCAGEADSYGRYEWSFSLNLETGVWTKLSLAY